LQTLDLILEQFGPLMQQQRIWHLEISFTG
jgi:hypothetical protein